MDNKYITVLVVPDRKSKVRKVTFSASHLKIAGWVGAIAFILMAAVIVDYISLLAQSLENKRLHAENQQFRAQFQVVEGKLNTLEKYLEGVREHETKLRTIMKVKDPDRGLNLSMGPVSRNKEVLAELRESSAKRAPASKLMSEPVFKAKNMSDFVKGEIAREQSRGYARLSVRLDRAIRIGELRNQGLQVLWEKLQDRSALLASTPSSKPVRGWYTSRFGYRLSPITNKPQMHEGLDIAAAPGSPIYSPADGVVGFAGYDPGYGKLIIIDHGYGVETRYGHNSQLNVRPGQSIKHGDLIAKVGNTGKSTGPHLHYEVRVNGEPVDPLNYILD